MKAILLLFWLFLDFTMMLLYVV